MFKSKIAYPALLMLYLSILLIGSLPALPLPRNRRLFIVSSGSMEPNLYVGTVVIAQPQTNYQVGDIITFSNPDKSEGVRQTTTHRVEKLINRDGEVVYMTKGDANFFSDGKFVAYNQIIGKVDQKIANLGILINIIKSKLGLTLLLFIPGFLIVSKEVLNIITMIQLNQKQTKDSQDKKKK